MNETNPNDFLKRVVGAIDPNLQEKEDEFLKFMRSALAEWINSSPNFNFNGAKEAEEGRKLLQEFGNKYKEDVTSNEMRFNKLFAAMIVDFSTQYHFVEKVS